MMQDLVFGLKAKKKPCSPCPCCAPSSLTRIFFFFLQFLGMTISPATLVSEYCSRGSLMDVLRAGKSSAAKAQELGWPRRMAMAADACMGMCYLHTRQPPIIHRDLKSPNLLVDASWKVKVSDFGEIAFFLQEIDK
jgi:serine/threonine protein kinase